MTRIVQKIKDILIGKARNPHDKNLFHKISLVALLAWVGLGADGISSSCYGPPEAFVTLGHHYYLAFFVAVATVFTIFVISASYTQIVEVFPSEGGGYYVASKLLSPTVGMVSGCALIIDYVLTIAISVASGTDAIYSFLPQSFPLSKIIFAVAIILTLTLLNLRGVKESVSVLVPIFIIFMVTHVFAILYAIGTHASGTADVIAATARDIKSSHAELGLAGMLLLVARSYSMGAGTYTGLEAVSNGMPVLREPKIQTAKKTMFYMALSLSFLVIGLMTAYIFYHVSLVPGKTLNAVLLEKVTSSWPLGIAGAFILITLVSEAALLFVAAQTGFLGGPRVIASMATDRWFPSKFAILSDRLVTQNGIFIMSAAAVVTLIFTKGSVELLVILYSINVFITFVLSQLGMVFHWIRTRKENKKWLSKIFVNGIGLVLTTAILCSMLVMKFHDGGWLTVLITMSLVAGALIVKKHYQNTWKLLKRLDTLVEAVNFAQETSLPESQKTGFNPRARTAILFVNGYNGLGLHTLFNIIRLFGDTFKNYVFIQIGVIDASNFKSEEELKEIHDKVKADLSNYVLFIRKQGYHAEGISRAGIGLIEEAEKVSAEMLKKYPNALFFGGQLAFKQETVFSKWLHNYTVFTLQNRFYQKGIPFFIVPIRIDL
jgi:amino acid transporter